MGMDEMNEVQFIGQFEGYVARRVAREVYRAMHPTGMHTNGPTIVRVEASHLLRVLEKWKRSTDPLPPCTCKTNGEIENCSITCAIDKP